MYQPLPIKKQHVVSPPPKIDMVEPESAIMINLKSITTANETQVQKEVETASVLSQFTPLSITPVSQSGEFYAAGRERVREISQPSLQELEDTISFEPVDFKPKRRAGGWLALLAVLGVGLFVSARVGSESLMNDPINAIQLAFRGQVTPPEVVSKQPQIEEVIESGELTVTVSEPTLYAKDWIVVEGTVENSTGYTQTEITLQASLTFERGATVQEKFVCCSAPSESDRAVWISDEVTRIRKSGPLPEVNKVKIPPLGAVKFLKLYKRPSRTSELPNVSAKVMFYEPITP